MATERGIDMELSFKRVPTGGLQIPHERCGDWHKWLIENNYWLGDFCILEGAYCADMEVREDGNWYILPPKARR